LHADILAENLLGILFDSKALLTWNKVYSLSLINQSVNWLLIKFLEMGDNLHLKRPQDSSKVNVNEDWEVQYWCGKWGVTKAQLVAAVKAVGVSATAVAKHLGK
jgi:Protein of unknown function (DUF3606)